MANLVGISIGFILALAMAAFGRWVYFNPERFLKIWGEHYVSSRESGIRFFRLVGALWLFVVVMGVMGGVLSFLVSGITALQSEWGVILVRIILAGLVALPLTKVLLRPMKARQPSASA